MIFSSDLVITQDGPTHLLMLHTLNMNMFCEQPYTILLDTYNQSENKMFGLQHQIMMYVY